MEKEVEVLDREDEKSGETPRREVYPCQQHVSHPSRPRPNCADDIQSEDLDAETDY